MSSTGSISVSNGEVEFTLFIGNLVTFENAEIFCKNQGDGSSLARISNNVEFNLVQRVIEVSDAFERIWIGKILKICFTILLFSLGLRGEDAEADVTRFFFVDAVNEDMSFIHTNRGQFPWANDSELLQDQPNNLGGDEDCVV